MFLIFLYYRVVFLSCFGAFSSITLASLADEVCLPTLAEQLNISRHHLLIKMNKTIQSSGITLKFPCEIVFLSGVFFL